MALIIKSDELAIISNRLEKLGRSDFPIAVRSTLNNMAFKMQKTELPKSANIEFDYNRTNIVKNLSWATKAKGFNVKNMRSQAGIRSRPNRQKVAKGLASQEVGGKIEGRTTPTTKARGGSVSSKVRPSNRLGNRTVIDARLRRREKFIAAASTAKKQKALLLVKTNSGAAYARVSKFRRRKKAEPQIKLNWLYSLHNDDKKISVSNTRKFVKKAYINTMKGFLNEFKRQANRRFAKK
jgi:hypothetical protein